MKKRNVIDMQVVFKYHRKLNDLKEIEEELKNIKEESVLRKRKEILKLLYSQMRMSIILDDIDYKNEYYTHILNEVKSGINRNTLHR